MLALSAAVMSILALHFGQRIFVLVQPGGSFRRALHVRQVIGKDMPDLAHRQPRGILEYQYNRPNRVALGTRGELAT